MRTFSHPLSRYGLAIVCYKNKLATPDEVTHQMLIEALRDSLRHFRLNCLTDASLTEDLVFEFIGLEDLQKNQNLVQSAGLSSQGKYLATNIIADEKSVKHTYNGLINLIGKLQQHVPLNKPEALTMSIAPVSGKINNGKTSQSNPTATLLEVACSAIASTTPLKPCFSLDGSNLAVIPDLPIAKLISFVEIFDKILNSERENLLRGKGKDGKYRRPLLFRGNYPDAPFNPIFGPIGIIAAIGKWSKEANDLDSIKEIYETLNALAEVPIYIISYGSADIVYYNHYLIELAQENILRNIVGDLERSTLISEERKTFESPKYKLFYLFASRFLQLFNEPSFKDFLSFRAYYEPELIHLFNIYFNVMEIPKEIVTSAREYGKWLNYVAYYAALAEDEKASHEKIKKSKSKFMIELESAVFSSKSGTELFSYINTRAGRLMHQAMEILKRPNLLMEAPAESREFIEASMSGQITLEQAQHMITAFSRLRNKFEKTEEQIKEETQSLEM